MPSGALNEFECTVDAASNNRHQAHFQLSSIVDVCWQQSSRPDSPVSCTLNGSSHTSNGNDPSTKSAPKEDDEGGGESTHGNLKGTRDELAKIREGFDAWLAAFRKSRPHRDVIWRVGKKERVCSTKKSVTGLFPVVFQLLSFRIA